MGNFKVTNWLNVCVRVGEECIHSLFAFLLLDEIVGRREIILSHTIHIIIITEVNEIKDPRDEIIFHGV